MHAPSHRTRLCCRRRCVLPSVMRWKKALVSNELQEELEKLAAELGVVGVAAGVLLDGQESYAFAGVTSVENPLPVDEATLFQVGSVTKTFTATALLRLVEQ